MGWDIPRGEGGALCLYDFLFFGGGGGEGAILYFVGALQSTTHQLAGRLFPTKITSQACSYPQPNKHHRFVFWSLGGLTRSQYVHVHPSRTLASVRTRPSILLTATSCPSGPERSLRQNSPSRAPYVHRLTFYCPHRPRNSTLLRGADSTSRAIPLCGGPPPRAS